MADSTLNVEAPTRESVLRQIRGLQMKAKRLQQIRREFERSGSVDEETRLELLREAMLDD